MYIYNMFEFLPLETLGNCTASYNSPFFELGKPHAINHSHITVSLNARTTHTNKGSPNRTTIVLGGCGVSGI